MGRAKVQLGPSPRWRCAAGCPASLWTSTSCPRFSGSLPAADAGPPVNNWAGLLEDWGFDSRHIDQDGDRVASIIAAEGAWRLASRVGFVRSGLLTSGGRAVSTLADNDAGFRRKALAQALRPGVDEVLVGQGGVPIVPEAVSIEEGVALFGERPAARVCGRRGFRSPRNDR